WSQWSTPKVWSKLGFDGRDGQDGKDGKDIEYIYRLHNNNTLPNNLNPLYKDEDEYHSPETGWTDDPQGVNVSNQYEFIAKRTKVNGVWSSWSTPMLWAKLGLDGDD